MSSKGFHGDGEKENSSDKILQNCYKNSAEFGSFSYVWLKTPRNPVKFHEIQQLFSV